MEQILDTIVQLNSVWLDYFWFKLLLEYTAPPLFIILLVGGLGYGFSKLMKGLNE